MELHHYSLWSSKMPRDPAVRHIRFVDTRRRDLEPKIDDDAWK